MPLPMRRPDLLSVLAVLGGIAYPFVVYVALPYLPPGALVALALGLGALHLLHRPATSVIPRWAFVLIPVVLLILLGAHPLLAAQAYPPLVSLSLAAAFAWSLAFPPSAIERLARLTRPDLPPAGVAYTRTVTKVWTVFFLANAAIAILSALFLPVAIWALWTGLISYLCIGLLFGGELLLRRAILRPQP